MQCWVGYHRVFALGVGVPLLLLICVGFPACILYKTLSYRRDLANPHVIQHYGFLFRAYRSRFCWWECVVVLQTEALVAVSVFGHSIGPIYQALFANAMLALMTIILMMARPHAHAAAYRVMLHAMCCLVLTSYISISFIPSGSYKAGPIYGIIMGCVLVLLNASYVVSVLWQMHKLMKWEAVAGACRGFAYGVGGWCAGRLPWCADKLCCCIVPPELPTRRFGNAGFSFRHPAEQAYAAAANAASTANERDAGKDPAAANAAKAGKTGKNPAAVKDPAAVPAEGV